MSHHLHPHIQNPTLVNDNLLHVVCVVSNTSRYHSRYRLARKFIEEMKATPNVRLYIVEQAYGDRHYELTRDHEPHHLQVRSNSEIWTKENLINLGVKRLLPRDWKYVAWVDADVSFRDPNWALETLHQLQHFSIVQPWQQCTDLGFVGDIMHTHHSIGYLSQMGRLKPNGKSYPHGGHSGYAWAATRAFWEQTGGLLEVGILGSGDHHMALSCLGEADLRVSGDASKGFFRKCAEWRARAIRVTHKEIGYVNGRIEHGYHGQKADRKYADRWKILAKHDYDPDVDLMHDSQGLIQLVGKPALEADIRKYNRSRNEDAL